MQGWKCPSSWYLQMLSEDAPSRFEAIVKSGRSCEPICFCLKHADAYSAMEIVVHEREIFVMCAMLVAGQLGKLREYWHTWTRSSTSVNAYDG
jgi:hypothetical protein